MRRRESGADCGALESQAQRDAGGGIHAGQMAVAGFAARRHGSPVLIAQTESMGSFVKMGDVFPEPEMKKGRLEADLFKKQMVPRRGLGHTCATPAALASAAFRVLTQSAQALCFLGLK
ncbi:hypothetical protein ACN8ZM_08110 [Burkholderia aenigmatica]|uniref:hypothetical protein n=1 Tax=Burkholderia aenigmatica TaxID=2015348 RepID=UPI003B42FBE5